MRVEVFGYKVGGSFEAGPLVLLVGPNGSGKSTLLEGAGFALGGVAGGQDITRTDAARSFLSERVMQATIEIDGKVSTHARELDDGTLRHAVHTGDQVPVYLDVDFVGQTPGEQGRLLLSLGGQPGALEAVERRRKTYNAAMKELRRMETVREEARKSSPRYVEPGSADKLLAEAQAADRERGNLQRELDAVRHDLAQVESLPEPLPVKPSATKAADADVRAAVKARRAAEGAVSLAEAQADRADELHKRIAGAGGCCPTCTQSIPAEMVGALAQAAEVARLDVVRLKADLQKKVDQEREAREVYADLQQRVALQRKWDRAAGLKAKVQEIEVKLTKVPEPDFAAYREKLQQEQAYARLHKAVNAADKAMKKAEAAREALQGATDARDAAVQAGLGTIQDFSLLPGTIVFSPKLGLGIDCDGAARYGRGLSEGQRLLLNQSLNRAIRPDDSPRVVLLEVDHLDSTSLRLLQDSLAVDHATGEVALAILATCHPVLDRSGWDVVRVPEDVLPAERPPIEPKRTFNMPVNPHRLAAVVKKISSDARKALIAGAMTGGVKDELCYQGFVTDGALNDAAGAAQRLLLGSEVGGVRMRGVEPAQVAGGTELEIRAVLSAAGVLVNHLRLLGGSAKLKDDMIEQLAKQWAREGITVERAQERVKMAQEGETE